MDLSRRRRPRPKDRLFGRVDRAQRFCRKYVVRRMRKLVRCMHRLITLTHAKKPESDNYRLRPPTYVSTYFDCWGIAPRPSPTRAYLKLPAATDASRQFHISIPPPRPGEISSSPADRIHDVIAEERRRQGAPPRVARDGTKKER
jgi:hypothetical protein